MADWKDWFPPAVESYIRVHQVYDFRKGLQA